MVAAALSAQDGPSINIEFEAEGEREVWLQGQGDSGKPPSTHSFTGKAVKVEVPTETRGVTVFVHDKATGNVATKSLRTIVRTRTDTWRVRSSEESRAFRMTFRIEHDGLPVESAIVKLTGRGFDEDELLAPADNGTVSFYALPYGDYEVTVEYKTRGISKSLPAQEFEAKAGSAEQEDHLLEIDDDVETIAPQTTEEEAAEEEPQMNVVATILNMVIGIVAIGGISYMIWRYVKANPDQTADALKKAGVQVPDDQAGTAMTAPKPAGPPEQIILGDAAPDAAQADVPQPVATGVPAAKNPRLVSADGSIFIVQEGVQTAGRDGDLELSLENESSVSRQHAQISRTGDTVMVMDLGSTNGTYLNGTRVAAEVTLAPGDVIQFGAVRYRYEE